MTIKKLIFAKMALSDYTFFRRRLYVLVFMQLNKQPVTTANSKDLFIKLSISRATLCIFAILTFPLHSSRK